jgi:hypothetical protein
VHETVNHSVKFVHPGTGVYTQSIESYWAKTKYKFKIMKGVAADSLHSKDAFEGICNHIVEHYPV